MKTRSISAVVSAFVFASFFIPIIAWGQAPTDLGRSLGNPNTIYYGTELEQVDTSGGSLRINLPLIHLPGRGMDLDVILTYDSKVWDSGATLSSDPTSLPDRLSTFPRSLGKPMSLGWNIGVPRMGFIRTDPDECYVPDQTGSGGCDFDILHSEFLRNDGSTIALVSQDGTSFPPQLPMWSFDGSFALLTSRGLIYPDGTTAGYALDSQENPTFESLTDTNGNLMTCSFSSVGPTGCTDTLGRQITYALDPASGQLGSVTYLDSSGISRSVTFQYTPFTLNYPFRGGNSFCTDNGATPFNDYLLTSVTLANGLKYTFEYFANTDGSTTGEITKITLPTAGYIRYTYASEFVSYDLGLGRCGLLTIGQNRVVTHRYVSPDGTASSEQPWSYSFASFSLTSGSGQGRSSTITDPLGNSQVYSRDAASALFYQTDYKAASGALLKSILGHAESSAETAKYFYSRSIFTNPHYKTLTTILGDTNQQSQITFTYGSFNNVTEKDETDWGPGAPGGVIRKSTFSYWHDSNPAYAGDSVHILDRVNVVSVCDAGSTFCSQTTTKYDEAQPTSTGSNPVIQHDYTNYAFSNSIRGNPTSISRSLNTTGGSLVTTNTYNDVGNLILTQDPNGNQSTISFADNFANGIPSQPTSAYPTTITRPTTNGVSHIQRFQYYLNSGLTAASCGENFPAGSRCATGLTSAADYQSFTYDLLNRPFTIVSGDGGGTTFTYNEVALPINYASSTKIDSTHNLTRDIVYDGLGRISQTQLTSDPSGTTSQLTTYDALGRKSNVYNPTRCNPPATNCGESTWGYTQFAYDGLGRTTTVTSQDSGITISKYSGNTVTVTDQAGKQRRSATDALGRLIEVDEPTSAPIPNQNDYATMQTDGNFVLYNPSGTALWATGTAGSGGSSIEIQDDGNFVLYIEKWQAGTYATPSPGPFPVQTCRIGSALNAPQNLLSNQCIVSPRGQYMLYMQTDGNLVIYNLANNTVVTTWAAGTFNHPGAYASMQTDGNLVVYSSTGAALWSSGTSGTLSQRLEMEDDGRIIIFRSAWDSGTSQGWSTTSLTHPGCDIGTGTGWTGALATGQCFVSPNGRYDVLMQADGDLALYDLSISPANRLWHTGTAISPVDPSVASRTLYTYDALGNLTCVEQHGNVSGTGCSSSQTSDASSPWRVRRFTYDSLSRLLTAHNPESGTISYSYDPDGNLLQKTSPAPNQPQGSTLTQTISYCYDALNRLTGKAYSQQSCPLSSPVVTYSYDQGTFNGLTISNPLARRTGMTDQAGAEAWSYDLAGRPSADTRTTNGVTKSTNYLYNFLGSATSITYPGGRTITVAYNTADQSISAADAPNSLNYAGSALYIPAGQLSSLKTGPNFSSTFYYNSRLQPCRAFVSTGTTNPSNCGDTSSIGNILDFNYSFALNSGDNGNLVSISNNRDSTRNQSFTYDVLNRVATAQTASTSGTKCFGETFGYDAWGNLLSIGGLSGYAGCTQELLSAGASLSNQISTNAYDIAGNMTTGGYTYDPENRLLTAGGVTYTYDGDGRRVKKSSGKLYWYGMGSDVLDETDLTGSTANSAFNEYIFFDGERTARRDFSNNVFYYFGDHLGTSRVIAQSGQSAGCYDADFYPFGDERTPFVNTCPQNYKFTGKERDAESGLDDFGARYYSSALGRFISADWSAIPAPVPYADFAEPQSLNLYSYVAGNPSSKADADGHQEAGLVPHKEPINPLSYKPQSLTESLRGGFHELLKTISTSSLGSLRFSDRLAADKNSDQEFGGMMMSGALILFPGGESDETTLATAKLAEAFGFKEGGIAFNMVGGELENGAAVQASFSMSGKTLNIGISIVDGPKGTLGKMAEGVKAAGKAAGASEVNVTAKMTTKSMGRWLRREGFKQEMKDGKATGNWTKTVKVDDAA